MPVLLAGLLTSCEKFLDVPPEDLLTQDEHFQDKYDADAAVRGIYGELVNLGPRYIILNELRADLMDVTRNAGVYLREINLHDVGPDNPYADPTPFYALINDCNDVMHHFDLMLKDLKFSKEEYDQRYSDIAALRCWLYLELVTQYGEVPYITTSIDRVSDENKIFSGEFPVLGIEAMVDTLIGVMESLPYMDLYTDPSFRTVIDGFDTRVMFIDKEMFLGDLYLWKGDYLAAASMYKNVMERDVGQNTFNCYKLVYPIGDPYTLPHFNSGYVRYYWEDINSALNNWPFMFYSPQTSDYYCEWLWALYYHDSYAPENPFLELFSKDVGDYLFKPSQYAIDNWDAQIQQNGFETDFRGLGGSYDMEDGDPVITKYISSYDPLYPFERGGQWHLMRTGGLHLRFIEAANRDGQFRLSMALMNRGIRTAYGVPGAVDITYLERTNLPFPYNFDGRQGSPNQIPPGVRGLYYRNVGVRGRVYLEDREIPPADSLLGIENAVLDESALELAYEGQRWGDLVRIAIRRNDPSILADRIYEKLQRAGYAEAGAVRDKLMNRDNWFLPLDTGN